MGSWIGFACATFAVVLSVCDVSTAAEFVLERPEAPPLFQGQTELAGGKESVPENWPASIRFKYKQAACSATLIGPGTILTAAHCLEDGLVGKFSWQDASDAKIVCEVHPQYISGDRDHDVALCESKAIPKLFPGVAFERINTNEMVPTAGELVLLQGYGCVRKEGVSPSGILYEGTAAVAKPNPDQSFIRTFGEVSLCSGDSGGAAFLIISDFRRVIVGVNSKGFLTTESNLSALTLPSTKAFLKKWTEVHKTKICGLGQDEGCHD